MNAAPEGESPNPEKSTRVNRSGYLPVLPDDWAYRITADGPSGDVQIAPMDTGGYAIHVSPQGGDTRTLNRDTLSEAIKVGATSVKALDRLARTEAEYARARSEVLASLDGDTDDDVTPAVEEPVSAGDLTKDDEPQPGDIAKATQ